MKKLLVLTGVATALLALCRTAGEKNTSAERSSR